jgi:hypothetical protein
VNVAEAATSSRALLAQLAPRLEPSAHTWLAQALTARETFASTVRLRVTFARVARKLSAPAASAEGEPDSLVDRARTALLSAALERTPAERHVALVAELYRTGEHREQHSVLRALPHLPEPARFTELAIEACRTNSLLVFGAIAGENPLPAAHFPALHFNQLVLKALFLGFPVERIVGLGARITDELARMVRGYQSERLAAGRVVPRDVERILALCER